MEDIEKLKKIIEDHEDRISKLEKKLSTGKPVKPESKKSNYSGLSGGIRMLIDNKFLDAPKSASEVFEEMKREGRYDSKKNVDGTLRMVFVKNKILQRIKDDKLWKYVVRK